MTVKGFVKSIKENSYKKEILFTIGNIKPMAKTPVKIEIESEAQWNQREMVYRNFLKNNICLFRLDKDYNLIYIQNL